MIVLAYDHRAYELMQKVEQYLKNKGQEVVVCASKEYDKTDSYSMFAKQANKLIVKHDAKGIYSCRTGIGITMAANRAKGVRAGICQDKKTTFLARNDDDINVLVLPAETTSFSKAKKLIDVFLTTAFEGGRHVSRIKALDE